MVVNYYYFVDMVQKEIKITSVLILINLQIS